jgi:hypothetical protein
MPWVLAVLAFRVNGCHNTERYFTVYFNISGDGLNRTHEPLDLPGRAIHVIYRPISHNGNMLHIIMILRTSD